MYVLRLRNRSAQNPGNREPAIPIEAARVCSVCWTVHQSDECPECKARQWRNLVELLEVLGLDPGVCTQAPGADQEDEKSEIAAS